MNCEAADGQTERTLREVCKAFRIPGELEKWETITRGNINTTIRVYFYNPNGQPHEVHKSYLVQKVNAYVFKNPRRIMQNIERVTTHIRAKTPGTVQLHYHHTAEGKNYYAPGRGAFWRLSNYIDSVTFDTCTDLAILRSTGKAFGNFQRPSRTSTTRKNGWTECSRAPRRIRTTGRRRSGRNCASWIPCAGRRRSSAACGQTARCRCG